MKTVNIDEFREELAECNKQLQSIELNKMPFRDTIEVGVNWSAMGTVSVERAREFANELSLACHLATNFKYNGYKITY